MAWKDKDGKDIDVSGVDEKIVNVVGAIVGGAVAQAAAGLKTAIAETVTGAVKTQLEPLAAKVGELEKAKPDKAEGDKGGGSGGGGGADLAKIIAEQLKPITESITALKTERDTERAQATSRQLAEAYVTKHFPNLKGREQVIARIAAAGVKTDEEAKARFEEWKSEITAFGIDFDKQLSAKPEAEGAKGGGGGGKDGDAAEAKAALLKQIREREPVAKAG